MNIIKQSHTILDEIDGRYILGKLEYCGRIAYKSEDRITDDSAELFIRKIIERGHESVLEHDGMSVLFVTDRGITHELVRHRLASFTQESTRYCNYSKGKFGSEITVIEPVGLNESAWMEWKEACELAESRYFYLLDWGKCTPQEARAVLPTSLKAEIVVTANWREWRHILRLRTDKAAHPQMRALMIPLLKELKEKVPVLFEDILLEEV